MAPRMNASSRLHPVAGGTAEVAVLMPHFGCENYLAQAVKSILDQREVSLNLHVVDDCSPTEEWKRALAPFCLDPRLKLFQTDRNVGPWRIDNWLFKHVREPYIAFQDADDYSDLDRLRLQLDDLKRNHAGMVGCSFFKVSETGDIVEERAMPRDVNRMFRRGKYFGILHATTLMRRSILDRLGGLDGGDSGLGADTDFQLRAMFDIKMINIERPLYYYRQRATSLTNTSQSSEHSPARVAYKKAMYRRHRARKMAHWLAWRKPMSLLNTPNDVNFSVREWTVGAGEALHPSAGTEV
jgi:glycosyltransferase involved in cell wall biosynthesis